MIQTVSRFEKTKQFEQACISQDVQVIKQLTDQYPRHNVHGLVEIAADYFHSDPNDPLANKTVEGNVLAGDIGGRALQLMINGSVEPNLDPSLPKFKPNDSIELELSCCSYAEFSFAKSLQYIGRDKKDVQPDLQGDAIASQLIMHKDKPLLFMKGIGVHSCLTLQDVRVGPIKFLAGSLLACFPPEDFFDRAWNRGLYVSEVEMPIDARMLRLSLFTYPLDKRTDFLGRQQYEVYRYDGLEDNGGKRLNPKTRQLLTTQSIETISDYLQSQANARRHGKKLVPLAL